MARRSGPSTAVSCISRSFRTVIGQPRLLYRARRSRHDRTRARASLQCRFRAGMHQSVLIYALREQHRVCSGSMNEPKLVDPVELEVGEDAEAASLSGRTACSGVFCASKQHQSILSSIQRHRRCHTPASCCTAYHLESPNLARFERCLATPTCPGQCCRSAPERVDGKKMSDVGVGRRGGY